MVQNLIVPYKQQRISNDLKTNLKNLPSVSLYYQMGPGKQKMDKTIVLFSQSMEGLNKCYEKF